MKDTDKGLSAGDGGQPENAEERAEGAEKTSKSAEHAELAAAEEAHATDTGAGLRGDASIEEQMSAVLGETSAEAAAAEEGRKRAELRAAVEAIIYVADEPATVAQIADALEIEKAEVRRAVEELEAASSGEERGIEIRRVAGGYKFFTKPSQHEVLRKFIKSLRPPLRLSMPALETLAVIAYKQPITLPEIQEIRGVNCAGVIQTLLDRRQIVTAGRKQVMGRPILYRTSKEFLMRFGLGDVDELPSLREFEALAREALGAEDGLLVEESGVEMAGDELMGEGQSAATEDVEKTKVAGQGGEGA